MTTTQTISIWYIFKQDYTNKFISFKPYTCIVKQDYMGLGSRHSLF